MERSALAKMLPPLWFYLLAAKVNVGLCVWDGICLEDAPMEDVWSCFSVHLLIYFIKACAAEHTDVSFRGGDQ